jgi:hypothetical protein
MSQVRTDLPRDQWRGFFENLTKDFEGYDVSIEVVDREYGDELEAERLPLAVLEYDDRDDAFIVAVGGRDSRIQVVLRHIIEHPQQVIATPLSPEHPWAVEVVEQDGTRTIVALHQRVALPPPQ